MISVTPLRRPPVLGALLLAGLLALAGLAPVSRLLVESVPYLAILEAVRMPSLPSPWPSEPTAYWLVDLAAIGFLLGTYWVWMRGARSGGRLRTFWRVLVATTTATLLGFVIRAVLLSFLTGDSLISYGLLIGGTLALALLFGLLLGVTLGVVVALLGAPPAAAWTQPESRAA